VLSLATDGLDSVAKSKEKPGAPSAGAQECTLRKVIHTQFSPLIYASPRSLRSESDLDHLAGEKTMNRMTSILAAALLVGAPTLALAQAEVKADASVGVAVDAQGAKAAAATTAESAKAAGQATAEGARQLGSGIKAGAEAGVDAGAGMATKAKDATAAGAARLKAGTQAGVGAAKDASVSGGKAVGGALKSGVQTGAGVVGGVLGTAGNAEASVDVEAQADVSAE
jgi:hypothetical protein